MRITYLVSLSTILLCCNPNASEPIKETVFDIDFESELYNDLESELDDERDNTMDTSNDIDSGIGTDTVEELEPVPNSYQLTTLNQLLKFNAIRPEIFTMGSSTDEVGREIDETSNQVILTHDYYVMTTEVTQAQWSAVMGYDAYDNFDQSSYNRGQGSNHPVYYVSWHMSADFANAVTALHNTQYSTSLTPCYTCTGTGTEVDCIPLMNPYQCDGYRLPTEAEWEFAARDGINKAFWTSLGGGDIPLGEEFTVTTLTDGTPLVDVGWIATNSGNVTHEVGQKNPNGFGLYDMTGNVWEWTNDIYQEYPNSSIPLENPTGGSVGSEFSIRGGAWDSPPAQSRLAARARYHRIMRYNICGVRLFRSLP